MVRCNGVDDTGEEVAFLAKTGKKLNYFKNYLVFGLTKSLPEGSMIGLICWELDLQDSGMVVKSVEVEANNHTINGFKGYLVGNNDLFHDVPLGSTWKSEAFCGSKRMTLMAQTIGFKEAILMRAKVADAENGTKLRMVVKLQGKLTL